MGLKKIIQKVAAKLPDIPAFGSRQQAETGGARRAEPAGLPVITPAASSANALPLLYRRPDKEIFHLYFFQYKPYLNPRLCLGDLTDPLWMSRNRLSRFINDNFGMNYNRYVGFWRIYELGELRKRPEFQRMKLKEQLRRAGIGSYRTYIRMKAEYELAGMDAARWIQ